MTLTAFAMTWTLAIYTCVFGFYGLNLVDNSFSDDISCDGLLDCLAGFFEILVGVTVLFFNLATLGGFTGLIDPIVQGFLVFTVGFVWFLIWLGIGRGTSVS